MQRLSFRTLTAAMATALFVAACASGPERLPALEQARSAYSAASSNPQVNQLAAVELERAGAALRDAERAWSDERDQVAVRHLAYLARQRAEIAQQVARARSNEQAIASASTERERVRLEARTREADLAEQRGEAAKREALLAQQRSEAARQEALQAQRSAERLRQEAEAARQQTTEAQRSAAAEAERANVEAERAKRLQAQLEQLSAKQTPRGYVITLGDILFDVDRAELRSGARRSLERLAEFARDNPERRFEIDGFTDSQGSAEYNMGLSDRRANAVRQALIGLGVPANRIDVKAFGPAFPIASNDTPAGRQLNRRVEVVISDANGRVVSR